MTMKLLKTSSIKCIISRKLESNILSSYYTFRVRFWDSTYTNIIMENKLRYLKRELERAGEELQSQMFWIKNRTRNIDEQFKNHPLGDELNMSFNSLGEFQSSAVSVDVAIAKFCALQSTIKLLEEKE